MKYLIIALIAFAFCHDACAQIIKTLGFNTTNGQVVANTETNVLTFTNDVKIGGDFSITANGGAFQWGGVTFFEPEERVWYSSFSFDNTNIAASTRASLGFSTNLNTLWTATNASNARSAAGLPLAALTNTSNVTIMRALAGSTNTNEPYSGVVELSDGLTNYELTFSNGVLLKIISGI